MITTTTKASQCIKVFPDGTALWEIGADRIVDFSMSVFEVYKAVFGLDGLKPFGELLMEDVMLMTRFAKHFAITAMDGSILTTGRVMEKRPEIAFPLELPPFNINIAAAADRLGLKSARMFHGGRVSTHKGRLRQHGFRRSKADELFGRINQYAMASLRPDNRTAFFGELDQIAVRIYKRQGIPTHVLGEAQMYYGSLTFPVVVEIGAARSDHWLARLEEYQL